MWLELPWENIACYEQGPGWDLQTLSLKGQAAKGEMTKEKEMRIGMCGVLEAKVQHVTSTPCSTAGSPASTVSGGGPGSSNPRGPVGLVSSSVMEQIPLGGGISYTDGRREVMTGSVDKTVERASISSAQGGVPDHPI